MTVAVRVARPKLLPPLARAVVVTWLLAVAISVRWAVAVDGQIDALVVGAAFGAALLLGALIIGPADWPSLRELAAAVPLGLIGGAVLVGLALAVRWPGPWIPFTPAAAFAPWALVTVVVATGEELVLRGVLFDALGEAAGIANALVATSAAFALLHVPLYGWHVVPLDLGVGLALGGLRVLSGGTTAPAVAHAVADLATWWL